MYVFQIQLLQTWEKNYEINIVKSHEITSTEETECTGITCRKIEVKQKHGVY